MKRPPTKYAHSGDAMIAYQVMGDGPIDLILNGGPASHLDLMWEEPRTARTFERFASFSRMIRFDRRGHRAVGSREQSAHARAADGRHARGARGDWCGAQRRSSAASTPASAPCTPRPHPDRISSLVLMGVSVSAGSYLTPERQEQILDVIENAWGQGQLLPMFAPDHVGDRQFEEWWARFERGSATPSMARKIMELNTEGRPAPCPSGDQGADPGRSIAGTTSSCRSSWVGRRRS